MSGRYADAVETNRRREQHNDVLLVVNASDQPPTARDLALETNRSHGQVKRILAELREADRIRPVADPEDGRIVRYELAEGGERQ